MDQQKPIRRIYVDVKDYESFCKGWDASREFYTQGLITRALEGQILKQSEDRNTPHLTLSDLKFFYEIGVSCE